MSSIGRESTFIDIDIDINLLNDLNTRVDNLETNVGLPSIPNLRDATALNAKVENVEKADTIVPHYDKSYTYYVLLDDKHEVAADDEHKNITVNNLNDRNLNEIVEKLLTDVEVLKIQNKLTGTMITQVGFGKGDTRIQSGPTTRITFNTRDLSSVGFNANNIPILGGALTADNVEEKVTSFIEWLEHNDNLGLKQLLHLMHLNTNDLDAFLEEILKAQDPIVFLENILLSRVYIGTEGDLYINANPAGIGGNPIGDVAPIWVNLNLEIPAIQVQLGLLAIEETLQIGEQTWGNFRDSLFGPGTVGIGALVVALATLLDQVKRKADRIWDEGNLLTGTSGDIYHMSSGNVAIGIPKPIAPPLLPDGNRLSNRLEVNGNINIREGFQYKINDKALRYRDLEDPLQEGTNIEIVEYLDESIPDNPKMMYKINNTYLYELPKATGSVLGGVTIGDNITVSDGKISVDAYSLPKATASVLGGVMVDTTTIAVNATGVISAIKPSKWTTESTNNIFYNTGNVGIGKTSSITNKLEVNGNINIPTGSKYLINNQPFNYSDLAGTAPVSSKWTTESTNNIFYNTGNVGIGKTTALTNKLEVGGNLNISSGSKYKIGDVNLAFGDLGGTLPTAGVGTGGTLGGVRVDGSTITINGSGVISGANTYSLPTASTSVLGGVKVDGTTITINNQVITAVAGTQQLNSDWTQINTSLKSFILNKPTAGTNISFANNQISLTDFVGIGTTQPSGNTKLDVNGNINSTGLRINNLAIASDPTQNIINLSGNKLLINDKPDNVRSVETFTQHTSLSEPSITSPAFTETIRTFVHSGGTENQTSYNITIGQNTICDILIVGGGGAGGYDRAGGGGAGGLVFQTNIVLSGTINISVGRGGAVASIDTTSGGSGFNSSIGSIIALGGGGGGGEQANASDGGSGGGSAYNFNASHFGVGLQPTSTSGGFGNRGGDARDLINTAINRGSGGGGGAGSRGLEATSVVGGAGGDGLSGVGNVDFKTHFNLPTDNTIGQYILQENKVYFAGGGGAGECIDGQASGSIHGLGGKGGGSNGATNAGVMGSALQNSGGGGGGGGDEGTNAQKAGSKGGSGIVIIKFKSIINAGIPEGTTHKTLNFKYIKPIDNLIFYYRIDESPFSWLEAYNEAIANGRRLPNITELRTYMTDYPTMVAPFNNTDTWSAVVNPAVANSKDWVQIGSGTSHARGLSHTQNLGVYPSWGDNTTETFARVYWEVVDLNQANTYNLSVSEGTSISINSGTFQYLSGNYTISLGATQSSVLSLSGTNNPYPVFNISTIAIRYNMLRRSITLDYYKKSGFIKYVPSLVGGEFPDTGSWAIVDIDSQALAEFAGTITFDKIIGNLPLDKLQNIDMSKITTGTLDYSRISSQPALSSLSGNLDYSRITSQPTLTSLSGNLDFSRINNFTFRSNDWINDAAGYNRLYCSSGFGTTIKGYGIGANCVAIKNGDDTTIAAFNSFGDLNCNFESRSTSGMDDAGVINVSTTVNTNQNRTLFALLNTFTGFHRCYVYDELCNGDNVDIFRNDYKGRIVISTGKIKTDTSIKKEDSDKYEWTSLYDKDGITIEEAIPIIQLSRVKKDKRVYGVLGDPKRSSNNKNRLIVNSLGEGAICVCNSNGNIENGDYICSSDILGYGEKQDDDLLHNYSVAKAVMDCNFELDSPYYQCYELEGGVRVAFIACTYHCG